VDSRRVQDALRRLFKFLHTIGAIGLMGAMACLLAIISFAPASLAGHAAVMGAMANIATWVFVPSLAVTLIAGLLSIAVTPGYQDAGWVWMKAATGILIFEGGFLYVAGPIQAAAKNSARLLVGQLDPALVARTLAAERNTLWMLFAVAAANVALGVWRPRMPEIP
jgi:hypothetical protein